MTREEFKELKLVALDKVRRRALSNRIRVACGGLTFFEKIQIAIEAAQLVTTYTMIISESYPEDHPSGRLVNINYLRE